MQVLSYLAPVALAATGLSSPWALLPLVTLPNAIRLNHKIRSTPPGPAFNLILAETAQQALFYSLLLAVGVAL